MSTLYIYINFWFKRFHTVTENGTPWLDMSHIALSLNKLDAGTMEKVS